MPTIAETGEYIFKKREKMIIHQISNERKKFKQTISNYKQENEYLSNKHKYQPSTNGYFYIAQTTTSLNGKQKIVYKYGITSENDLNKRLQQYYVGNPSFRLLFYAPLDVDYKELEGCVKSLTLNHSIKKNNETVYFDNLSDLVNYVTECYSLLKTHLCGCTSCQIKLNIKNIDKHHCNTKLNLLTPTKQRARSLSKKRSLSRKTRTLSKKRNNSKKESVKRQSSKSKKR